MNEVKLHGQITRDAKHGGDGDKAWTFFSLRTKEERPTIIDVAAFGDAARSGADYHEGDEVKVLGRIGAKEDKKLSEVAGRKVWVLQVVAQKLWRIGKVAPPPPALARDPGEDDIGF